MIGDVQTKKEIADMRQILEDAGFTRKDQKPQSIVFSQLKDFDKRLSAAEKRINTFKKYLDEKFSAIEAMLTENTRDK